MRMHAASRTLALLLGQFFISLTMIQGVQAQNKFAGNLLACVERRRHPTQRVDV